VFYKKGQSFTVLLFFCYFPFMVSKLLEFMVYEQSPTLGAHAHGFWVGMGAMLLFMGGHGCDIIVHGMGMGGHRFCASLHPTPNQSQTSQMQEIR
jgi:hypothetical protein